MFFGQYEHTIDAKGRLTIPSQFRELVTNGVYVTQGFDFNLTVYPKDLFEKISEKINKLSFTDSDARSLRRFIFANTAKLEFDTAGRILIPVFLKEMAGIDSVVIIVGTGDNFEIWSPENWAKQIKNMNNPEANISRWDAMELST